MQLSNEVNEYLDLLFRIDDPIYIALLLSIIIVFIIYVFVKHIVFPQQKKFREEKEYLEYQNAKLMALFAELDPDPILRISEDGSIISSNDAAKKQFMIDNISKEMVLKIFKDNASDIKECIMNDRSIQFYRKIRDKHFSVVCKGISHLNFVQVYFNDITYQKIYEEEMKNHYERIQENIENERKRISRSLHDSLGQKIILSKLILQNSEDYFKNNDSHEKYLKITEALDSSITEIRKIAHDLRPRILEEEGLNASLIDLCESVKHEAGLRGKIKINVNETGLNNKIEILLYRIVQEALNNIIKHSKADEFNVRMFDSDNIVKLIIADNGIGFDPLEVSLTNKGFGILNMKERIETYGGKLTIDSGKGSGTILYFDIPIN